MAEEEGEMATPQSNPYITVQDEDEAEAVAELSMTRQGELFDDLVSDLASDTLKTPTHDQRQRYSVERFIDMHLSPNSAMGFKAGLYNTGREDSTQLTVPRTRPHNEQSDRDARKTALASEIVPPLKIDRKPSQPPSSHPPSSRRVQFVLPETEDSGLDIESISGHSASSATRTKAMEGMEDDGPLNKTCEGTEGASMKSPTEIAKGSTVESIGNTGSSRKASAQPSTPEFGYPVQHIADSDHDAVVPTIAGPRRVTSRRYTTQHVADTDAITDSQLISQSKSVADHGYLGTYQPHPHPKPLTLAAQLRLPPLHPPPSFPPPVPPRFSSTRSPNKANTSSVRVNPRPLPLPSIGKATGTLGRKSANTLTSTTQSSTELKSGIPAPAKQFAPQPKQNLKLFPSFNAGDISPIESLRSQHSLQRGPSQLDQPIRTSQAGPKAPKVVSQDRTDTEQQAPIITESDMADSRGSPIPRGAPVGRRVLGQRVATEPSGSTVEQTHPSGPSRPEAGPSSLDASGSNRAPQEVMRATSALRRLATDASTVASSAAIQGERIIMNPNRVPDFESDYEESLEDSVIYRPRGHQTTPQRDHPIRPVSVIASSTPPRSINHEAIRARIRDEMTFFQQEVSAGRASRPGLMAALSRQSHIYSVRSEAGLRQVIRLQVVHHAPSISAY